jgi:hypothetical protein
MAMKRIVVALIGALTFFDPILSAEGDLTPEQAKKLLPKAASLSTKGLENLTSEKDLPDKNQSLTYFLLTFRPPRKPAKDVEKDFEWIVRDPAKLVKAVNISRDKGFVSVIQEQYITECTCQTKDNQASGHAKFKCDVYKGSINFKAVRIKGEWVIREFEWPHWKVRFVRGDDGNWKQGHIKE